MNNVGKVIKGDLLLKDEVDERLPVVTQGLVAHFPFDGTLNHYRNSFKGLKVLAYFGSVTSHPWFDALILADANVTLTTDILNVTIENAKEYNLILVDQNVWAVTGEVISKLKSFTDAGVSCVAVGNDTKTNVFVKSYNTPVTRQTHSIIMELKSPVQTDTVTIQGSSDLFGGITELQSGAEPLYRRADTNEITGYLYEPIGGGAFYFDQEGFSFNGLVQKIIKYVIGKSKGGVVNAAEIKVDGLVLDETTTNLFSNGDFKNGLAGWLPSASATTHESILTPWGNGIRVIRGDGDNGNWSLKTSSLITFKNGFTYTWSMKFKVIRGTNYPSGIPFKVGVWGSDTGNNNYNPFDLPVKIYDLEDGWKYLEASYTYKMDYSSSATPVNSFPDNTIVDFADIQLEEKPYSSSFVNGSRSSVSNLKLEGFKENNFSISFKLKPKVEYYNTLSGNYNRTLLRMIHSDGLREIRYTDYTNAIPTAKYSFTFFDLEPNVQWNGSNNHYHHNISYRQEKWHDFFLVKSGSTLSVIVKLEGKELVNSAFNYTSDSKLSDFQLSSIVIGSTSNSTTWASELKDFSIYNKALTLEEINALSKTQLSITREGVLKHSVSENTLNIPVDSFYFPLGSNTNDITGMYKSTDSSNVIFEDGYLGVMKNIKNLAQFTYVNNNHVEILSDETFRFKKNCPSPNELLSTSYMDLSNSEYVTISYVAWVPKNSSHKEIVCDLFPDSLPQWNNNSLTHIPTRYVRTFNTSHVDMKNAKLRFIFDSSPVLANDIFIRSITMVNTNYRLPFVKNENSSSQLLFNFNRDLNLDWSSDWSIVYWKKPLGTTEKDLSGYNAESLGCNSNSVGAGYRWWGKGALGDQLSVNGTTVSNLSPSHFFNNIHMISVVKKMEIITYTWWGIEGKIMSRSENVGNIASNYFVNQHGYDFNLGSYDVNSPSNSLFRDLIVSKRAFNEDELKNLFSGKIKINKKISVQGEFIEGSL